MVVGRPLLDNTPVFSILIPAKNSEVGGGRFDPENMLAQPPKRRTIPKKASEVARGNLGNQRCPIAKSLELIVYMDNGFQSGCDRQSHLCKHHLDSPASEVDSMNNTVNQY